MWYPPGWNLVVRKAPLAKDIRIVGQTVSAESLRFGTRVVDFYPVAAFSPIIEPAYPIRGEKFVQKEEAVFRSDPSLGRG